jgi:hypothetical protein
MVELVFDHELPALLTLIVGLVPVDPDADR